MNAAFETNEEWGWWRSNGERFATGYIEGMPTGLQASQRCTPATALRSSFSNHKPKQQGASMKLCCKLHWSCRRGCHIVLISSHASSAQLRAASPLCAAACRALRSPPADSHPTFAAGSAHLAVLCSGHRYTWWSELKRRGNFSRQRGHWLSFSIVWCATYHSCNLCVLQPAPDEEALRLLPAAAAACSAAGVFSVGLA